MYDRPKRSEQKICFHFVRSPLRKGEGPTSAEAESEAGRRSKNGDVILDMKDVDEKKAEKRRPKVLIRKQCPQWSEVDRAR